ncbi:MAG: carbohydrate-binding domain-containing protein [Muribaculaceae bacterium]
MKKTLTLLAACAVTATAAAQSLNIVSGNVTYRVPAVQAGDMNYTLGSTLTVLGKDLQLSAIDRMYVDNSEAIDNTVLVEYSGTSAKVTVAGNVMRYVDATVTDGKVAIVQSADLGTDPGEINYRLSGTATGNFSMSGSYKSTLTLDNLNLTSPEGAAIDIQCGKRLKLVVSDGTVNTLVDAAGGTQKAALYSKGHVEVNGSGSLTVTGKTAHAISAKEYITVKDATIRVPGSVKDGLNCNQYFTLASGEIEIVSCGDDGLQVSFKDDVDREAEDTGTASITGGKLTISTSAIAAKGLKADGPINITDGVITISTTGGGKWDATDVKTKASTCISADGDITITGGTFDLSSSGGGGKCISCDGKLNIAGGTFKTLTSGGIFAYVNNTEYQNYTGNTDNLDSDYKSSPKAFKADGDVNISGGVFDIKTTGNGAEGIESKAILTISGGTIVAYCSDDCLNSSGHLYIKGGDITTVSSTNDGIDSNGNLYLEGGTVRTFGMKTPECGIDANEEEGFTVIFKGGTLLAAGSRNSTPSTAESTQPYVSCSLSLSAGQTVTVSNGSTTLASFVVPENIGSSSDVRPGGFNAPGGPGGGPGGPGGSSGGTLITCPGLVSGTSYTISNSTTSVTATAALKGQGGGFGM